MLPSLANSKSCAWVAYMRTIRTWLLRSKGIFNKERSDRDFAAELESHLQFHIDDNLRAGMSPEEARRQARAGEADGEDTRIETVSAH